MFLRNGEIERVKEFEFACVHMLDGAESCVFVSECSRVACACAARSDDATSIMVDESDQTPTHFIEQHIDPSYQWNEWELRKKAIQLVGAPPLSPLGFHRCICGGHAVSL